ncbi:hypothetical protein PFISCL1PPCAC_3387, partial [Pristionchus fissidentatus]
SLIFYDVCFFFLRIYAPAPFSALYCEGPLCRLAIDKRILMSNHRSVPLVFVGSQVYFSVLQYSKIIMLLLLKQKQYFSTLGALFFFFALTIEVNAFGFGYFGRDADDAPTLTQQEPELQFLLQRGGTLFMFGNIGNAQYFRSEMFLLCL